MVAELLRGKMRQSPKLSYRGEWLLHHNNLLDQKGPSCLKADLIAIIQLTCFH